MAFTLLVQEIDSPFALLQVPCSTWQVYPFGQQCSWSLQQTACNSKPCKYSLSQFTNDTGTICVVTFPKIHFTKQNIHSDIMTSPGVEGSIPTGRLITDSMSIHLGTGTSGLDKSHFLVSATKTRSETVAKSINNFALWV